MRTAQEIFDELNTLSSTVKNAYVIDFVFRLDDVLFSNPEIIKELLVLVIYENTKLSCSVMISFLTLICTYKDDFKQERKYLYLETFKKLVQSGDANPGATLTGLE